MKWINVKDRLPEHEEIVDIFTIGNYRLTDCMFANYPEDNGNNKHFYHEFFDRIIPLENVTHWMPLPKLPKIS